MASRQTYVIGALGVLVGMVVASSAHRAQMVSFAGHNPNSEQVRDELQTFRNTGIRRQRSHEEAMGNVFTGQTYRTTPPRRPSLQENVARRARLRSNRTMYFGAPEGGTVRGREALEIEQIPECAGKTGQRYTRCVDWFSQRENWSTF